MRLYFPDIVLLLIFVIVLLFLPMSFNHYFLAAAKPSTEPLSKMAVLRTGLIINDKNLKAEVIARGLKFPTNMAFLGPNDILVNEKLNGTVQRVIDGKIQPQPVLDVSVASQSERGMLGIAVAKPSNNNNGNNTSSPTYVFVSYTEAEVEGSDICPNLNYCVPGHDPLGNRLYRYELDNNTGKLVNPVLLLDLPAVPGPPHNGGKIIIGPDSNVYIGIGDVGKHRTESENSARSPADGTGGILRVTQDGQIVGNPPLGVTIPLALYYAYGIRNTFGMDFDPITGNLWDTENGNTFGDEINLVHPGFNSGWSQIAGIWEAGSKPGPAIGADSNNPPKGLVTFGGKGVYRAPELATLQTIGPTALKFLNSDRLGKQYENTIFMGDVDYGRLYNFKLNEDRTALILDGTLADKKIANTPEDLKEGRAVLGQGFGVITDIQVGPDDDGYLYILTLQG